MTEVSPDLRPESGFLLRLRTWRDALPWLALVDCLRPVTSVINLTLIGLTFWLSIGLAYAVQWAFDAPVGDLSSAFAPPRGMLGEWWAAPQLADAWWWLAGPTLAIVEGGSWTRLSMLVLHQALLLVVWAVPAAYLMRQCSLSMAGRLQMGTGEGLRLAAGRFFPLLVAALIPVLAVVLIWIYFVFSGLLGRIPEVGEWIAAAVQLLGLPLAIVAGLLAFGGLFAVPLAWAAVATEQEGSGFDGISRGYEYVLRRPLQLVFYGLIAAAITYALSLLARGVTLAAWLVIDFGYQIGSGSDDAPPRLVAAVVASLPTIVVLSLFWSLSAGLYLLLRRSANHQEIEDVWETPRPKPEPLPELKV
ncbi:hypothetical protein [Candidatus Laterigemmans baculatus]|uniref:hypothetical protein n=1 Tax=Candidatus Laterigemmans baculatus TaxID=2770505 RepID=UPI0013DD4E61|nr:hypothetical protein [Candidatus Laterigemmans baculatus]